MLKIRGTLIEVGGRGRVRRGYGIVGRREEHIGSRGRSSLGGYIYYCIYHSKHSIDHWGRDFSIDH